MRWASLALYDALPRTASPQVPSSHISTISQMADVCNSPPAAAHRFCVGRVVASSSRRTPISSPHKEYIFTWFCAE